MKLPLGPQREIEEVPFVIGLRPGGETRQVLVEQIRVAELLLAPRGAGKRAAAAVGEVAKVVIPGARADAILAAVASGEFRRGQDAIVDAVDRHRPGESRLVRLPDFGHAENLAEEKEHLREAKAVLNELRVPDRLGG